MDEINKIRKGYYKKLVEDQSSYAGSTFFRPDTSGIRGKGVGRKSYPGAGDKYPYDRDDVMKWGDPGAYSRDSAGHGGTRQNVPIPKHVDADDHRFDSVKEMGGEGWSSGTPPQGNMVDNPPRSRSKFGIPDEKDDPWNAKANEALGVPFNSAKAGQGTGGMHTGGRVMPGTSGAWSARPKGGKWDGHISDDELEKAGSVDEYNFGMPFAGSITQKVNPRKISKPELEVPHPQEIDNDKDMQDQLKVGGVKFTSTGNSTKNSRMQPGMTWKESFHRKLVEAFVSLADTPEQEPSTSCSAHDVDKDISANNFRAAHSQAKKRFDTIKEPELVKFLIQIEPDYFLNSLGKIGKDKLSDIYEQWADDVLNGDGQSVEKTTERIMKACGCSEQK